jgi:hypothetical protein
MMILRAALAHPPQVKRSGSLPKFLVHVLLGSGVTSGNERARDGLVGALSDLDEPAERHHTTPRPTGTKQWWGPLTRWTKRKVSFCHLKMKHICKRGKKGSDLSACKGRSSDESHA